MLLADSACQGSLYHLHGIGKGVPVDADEDGGHIDRQAFIRWSGAHPWISST
jgi:hypothetical protein